jgi:hypothetical protein
MTNDNFIGFDGEVSSMCDKFAHCAEAQVAQWVKELAHCPEAEVA